MKWHEEALPPPAIKAAQALSPNKWLSDFYLAGGTALALHYGHRVSVDLDFFSESHALTQADRSLILNDVASHKALIEEEKDGTLHLRMLGTHISFFVYRYPTIKRMKTWKGIQIADPIDIGLMKIGAIMGRGSKKDFFDLYEILKKETELFSLLRLSKKKFKMSVDFPLQACRALVYFDQAETEPMPKILNKVTWPEVKLFFQREVKRTTGLLF